MVYVRIELWPQGDESQRRLLQELVISNVGGDAQVGEYNTALSHSTTFKGAGFDDPARPLRSETWRWARGVKHWRGKSPADLVLAALKKVLSGEGHSL